MFCFFRPEAVLGLLLNVFITAPSKVLPLVLRKPVRDAAFLLTKWSHFSACVFHLVALATKLFPVIGVGHQVGFSSITRPESYVRYELDHDPKIKW